MEREIKRKKGGQPGNQNARKHGFYAHSLNKVDRRKLKMAYSVQGLDDEIALLRFKLDAALNDNPDNLKAISQALLALNRLMRTRDKMEGFNRDGLSNAIRNVLEGVAVPLGIGIGTTPGHYGTEHMHRQT